MPIADMVGKRFGRLVVLERAENYGKNPQWLCICDCGSTCVKVGTALRSEHVRSCGCLKRDVVSSGAHTSHGMRHTSIYRIWCNMKSRCHTETNTAYKDYGGRGIVVCERWRNSFENFYSDMGDRPAGKTLDRIDNDGPYSPENCRWSSSREQSNNTRKNVRIEHDGRSMSVSEWARSVGMTPDRLKSRLAKGWSIQRALTTPVNRSKIKLACR